MVEDVLGVDGARDGAEVMEGLADVGGHEICGDAGGQAGTDGRQGVGGGAQGLVVPEVRHDDGGSGGCGRGDFDEARFEDLQSQAVSR